MRGELDIVYYRDMASLLLHASLSIPYKMSTTVQTTDNIAVPTDFQDNFSSQYNMEDPEQARLAYMRLMHEHTKQQFQIATASSRRRNSPAAATAGLREQTSNTGSVSSVSD